jgi:hypothetical protein
MKRVVAKSNVLNNVADFYQGCFKSNQVNQSIPERESERTNKLSISYLMKRNVD